MPLTHFDFTFSETGRQAGRAIPVGERQDETSVELVLQSMGDLLQAAQAWCQPTCHLGSTLFKASCRVSSILHLIDTLKRLVYLAAQQHLLPPTPT
jgi:hypothetical protein